MTSFAFQIFGMLLVSRRGLTILLNVKTILSQLAQNNKDDEIQEQRGHDSRESAAYEILAAAVPRYRRGIYISTTSYVYI